MFKISSESELLEAFRPLDRQEVILPQGSQELKFPLLVRDYLAWLEPSGARVYLVFSDQAKRPPLGIVFRRDSGTAPLGMCEWCHSVRPGSKVGLLSATASSKKRVGLQLCNDLSCKDKLALDPGVNDLPGSVSCGERIREVIEKMARFARRELF